MRTKILVCTVIVGAISWALPAAAQATNAPSGSDRQVFGLAGRALNEGEMTDMRGRYARGSRVDIRVNGTQYTDSDPAPGSSSVTVNLGPNSVSRGFASTTGTSGSSNVSITLSGVTVRTSGGP